MIQRVKRVAVKTNDLNSVPRVHAGKGEDLDFHMPIDRQTDSETGGQIHTQISKQQFDYTCLEQFNVLLQCTVLSISLYSNVSYS